MKRNLTRLNAASEDLRVGKISGAVGAFGHIGPKPKRKSAGVWVEAGDIASK